MAGGRPTTYDDEVLAKARLYLEKYEEDGELVPTIAGLAGYIKRSRSVIYKWEQEKVHAEFIDILEEIKECQEKKLIKGGLSSNFNAVITKMMLTKHGYSDKQEIDHTSGGEKLQAPVYHVVEE